MNGATRFCTFFTVLEVKRYDPYIVDRLCGTYNDYCMRMAGGRRGGGGSPLALRRAGRKRASSTRHRNVYEFART